MFSSTQYPSYALRLPQYWIIQDRPVADISDPDADHAGVLFHIGQNDYFSNLATILKFYEESIYSDNVTPEMRILQLNTIKGVIDDLLYLEKRYVIRPKNADIERAHAKYF